MIISSIFHYFVKYYIVIYSIATAKHNTDSINRVQLIGFSACCLLVTIALDKNKNAKKNATAIIIPFVVGLTVLKNILRKSFQTSAKRANISYNPLCFLIIYYKNMKKSSYSFIKIGSAVISSGIGISIYCSTVGAKLSIANSPGKSTQSISVTIKGTGLSV